MERKRQPICAKLEQDIAELDDPEERAMFLADLGIEKSGLDRLIQCSYELLGLISFLTYGKDECRAWTIKKGTKAPQAAGKIHSDIERGFIRAEVVHTDSHNGPDGYQVRSLYFDSLSNRDFQEKEDGLELRRKFRLRVYSPDADFALFEMKQKQGPYQRKRSLRLSRREAQALIEGDYSVLLNSGSEFGQECYSIMEMWAYRPKTVVEYDRFAFIAPENSIRITFDSGIRANEVNFNIFDRNLVLNSVMSPFAVVLEVKYNGFLLSYIKHMLLPVQKSELSVSKYCMARQIGCDYRF